MTIIVNPKSKKEEKVLRSFLDSLEYEYAEEDLNIPPPPGAKRQTIEEYNQEISEAEAAYEKGEDMTNDELKKQTKTW